MMHEPISYGWLSAAGTFIGVANFIALGTLLFKFGQWMGKVDTRWVAREESDKERHEEQVERFERLEKKVGITNGGAAWVDKEFCKEVHRNFTVEVESIHASNAALAGKVDAAIEQGREAVRIGHEDRMAIKARLVAVEERAVIASAKADVAVLVARDESLSVQKRLTAVEVALTSPGG